MRISEITCFAFIALILSVAALYAHAQPSDYLQSPKKQLDSGISPHEIVCKNDLLLVERPSNRVACVTKETASIMGWPVTSGKGVTDGMEMQNNVHGLKSNSESNGTATAEKLPSSTVLPFQQNPSTGFTSDTYDEAFEYVRLPSEPPNAYHSLSHPKSVRLNEAFTVEYVYGSTKHYVPENGSNVHINIPEWVEFVDIGDHKRSDMCSNGIFGEFDVVNKEHVGNFSIKIVKPPPDPNNRNVVFTTFSDSGLSGIRMNMMNDVIDLSTKPGIMIIFCELIPQPVPISQNSLDDGRPDCISDYPWRWITDEEKSAIISNVTTCKVIDNVTVTNLPYDWHRIESINFASQADILDRLREYKLVEEPFDVEKYFHDQSIYQDWVDDFVSYYNSHSKRS